MASGGRVRPKQGVQYPNRSDLRKGPTQPIRTATGQTYGEAQNQAQGQAVIPLSQTPSPPQSAPGQSRPAAAAGGGGGGPQAITPLSAPTARPNEPLTHGISQGPGGGPEVLQSSVDPLVKAASVLNMMGGKPDPMLQKLRAQVNAHLGNQGAA